MKLLISAVRSQVFYWTAAFFALTGFCDLILGSLISWMPAWGPPAMFIGGTAGIVASLLADRHAARKAKPD